MLTLHEGGPQFADDETLQPVSDAQVGECLQGLLLPALASSYLFLDDRLSTDRLMVSARRRLTTSSLDVASEQMAGSFAFQSSLSISMGYSVMAACHGN